MSRRPNGTWVPEPMVFAITTIRARRHLTYDFLARETGLSKTHVWQVCNGRSLPSADTLCRFADVLGTTMDDLYRGIVRPLNEATP